MFHGLNNQFLYAAYKISATFADDVGNVKSGVGTCFFVMNRRGALCLVTNRHMLDITYKNNDKGLGGYSLRQIDVSGKIGRAGDNYPDGDMVISLAPNVQFHADTDNDVACITQLVTIGAGARIDYFIPYTLIATADAFQNKLTICDFLAFPGFPEWHDKAASRPILRTGTISSDPRFDYSYGDSVKGSCVAYEAFSYSGSSGSPVFAVQKGPKPGAGIDFPGFRDLLFVGINAGHLKTAHDSHSGISYLYKATAILDLIDQ